MFQFSFSVSQFIDRNFHGGSPGLAKHGGGHVSVQFSSSSLTGTFTAGPRGLVKFEGGHVQFSQHRRGLPMCLPLQPFRIHR